MAEAKAKPERFTTIKGTVGEFLNGGFEEANGVGEELREAYDNAPDNLKNSDVNERRDSAASEIESLSEPSISSSILEELSCSTSIDNGKVYRGRMSQSRACRCNNAAAQLRAAAEAISDWQGSHPPLEDDPDATDKDALRAHADAIEKIEADGYDLDDYKSAHEEADDLVNDLESAADTLEGLDIPGMFG